MVWIGCLVFQSRSNLIIRVFFDPIRSVDVIRVGPYNVGNLLLGLSGAHGHVQDLTRLEDFAFDPPAFSFVKDEISNFKSKTGGIAVWIILDPGFLLVH